MDNSEKQQIESLAKSGNLPQARIIAEKLCHENNNDPEAWFLLGVIYGLQGDFHKAIQSCERTITLAPQVAMAHFNLGVAYRNANQFQAAISPLEKALQLNPSMFAAHRELGIVYNQLGKTKIAIKCLSDSNKIHPANDETWFTLGSLHESQHDFKQAEKCYRKAIECNPQHLMAGINLGNVLNNFGRKKEAESWYKTLIQRIPDEPDILNNLAAIYQSDNKFNKAEKIYRIILDLQPNRVNTHRNLGKTLLAQNRPDEAILAFEKLVNLQPELLDNRRQLARAFWESGKNNQALRCLEENLRINPEHAPSHQDHACILLQQGNFKYGWKEYEWRTHLQDSNTNSWPYAEWTGSDSSDISLLVYPEQGIGDEIMFASCIPDLSKRVKNIVLICDPRLIDIYNRSFPMVKVIGKNKDEKFNCLKQLPKIDAQISIASLPYMLRPNTNSFPVHSGYLVASNKLIEKWHNRYDSLGSGINIGFSWRGGSNFDTRFKRSLEIDKFTEILKIPGINIINLQYGDSNEERALMMDQCGLTIHDWPDSNPLIDMDDFFAKIKALDLVLSIDNSTVHSAGAIGKKTWIMQPFTPDWRWQTQTNSSYWYPSIRQYRQASTGSWTDVLARVKNDLKHIEKKSPRK